MKPQASSAMSEGPASRPKGGRSRTKLALGVVVVVALTVAAGLYALSERALTADRTFIYYAVRRADLPITVTERGNLESQTEEKIVCEVDDIDGDDVRGTQVQFVVPNGSSVREGDLLIRLNSAGHIERHDRQILATEKARSVQITARAKHDNQITQNATAEAESQLLLDLAVLEHAEFLDQEGGTFRIDLQEVDLALEEAQASKLIEETNRAGVEQLYRLRYRSSAELAQARLAALKAERVLASAVSKKKQLVGYQFKKKELELSGRVKSAERALVQVKRDNAALLEQAKAEMDAADASLAKELERLERYRNYIDNCEIYAPRDGMVAYHVCRYHPIGVREGGTVQLQDHLFSIPDLRRMQVRTKVHESVRDLIHRGLPVTVRVEAFPDVRFNAEVHSVSVLPDTGEKSKIYTTVIRITEEVEQLKPGMTALCEIHVDLIRDALSVPVQAVVQIGRETWCYVDNGDGIERRDLVLGATNERFIEIREGVDEGDRVVLNPTALVDEEAASRSAIAPDAEIPENMDVEQIQAARRAREEDSSSPNSE